MKPTLPLTDPRFVYTNSASTDLRKTFARVRAGQAQQHPQQQLAIVVPLPLTRKESK